MRTLLNRLIDGVVTLVAFCGLMLGAMVFGWAFAGMIVLAESI